MVGDTVPGEPEPLFKLLGASSRIQALRVSLTFIMDVLGCRSSNASFKQPVRRKTCAQSESSC